MFRIIIHGREAVLNELEKLNKTLESQLPLLWKAVENRMETWEIKVWSSKNFGGWPPLKEGRYKQWKERKLPGTPLMELTTSLKRSLTASTPNSIRRQTGKTFEFGTSKIYGWAHQRGIPSQNLVARPILPDDIMGINPKLITELERAQKFYLRKVFQFSGIKG